MESDLIHKRLHLEFYGLPGCGKTTVSELVAQWLEADGYEVLRASAKIVTDVNPVIRKVIKLKKSLFYYILNPKIFKKVKELVVQNGYIGMKEQSKQLVNVAQKLWYYNQRSAKAIYIWDEGLTQAAISLSIKGKVSGRENELELKKLVKTDFQQAHIYLKESMDTALERMEARKTNNSRVEKELTLQGKYDLLKMFQEECDGIDSQIVIIGGGRMPVDLAKEIYKKLHQYGIINNAAYQ